MTKFKVGDRVRAIGGPHEGWVGQVAGLDDDGDIFFFRDGLRRNEYASRFELVTTAPSEPTEADARVLRRELVALRTELDAFKAKVVEVVRERIASERLQGYILEDLGLTPIPSRYRVTFEVEAKNEREALITVGEMHTEQVMDLATVEKIEEE